MPCCGQKRAGLQTNGREGDGPKNLSPLPVSSTARISTLAASAFATSVAIRYKERSRVIVEGAATRRRYEFSATAPVQIVDSRDAPILLNTRFFARS